MNFSYIFSNEESDAIIVLDYNKRIYYYNKLAEKRFNQISKLLFLYNVFSNYLKYFIKEVLIQVDITGFCNFVYRNFSNENFVDTLSGSEFKIKKIKYLDKFYYIVRISFNNYKEQLQKGFVNLDNLQFLIFKIKNNNLFYFNRFFKNYTTNNLNIQLINFKILDLFAEEYKDIISNLISSLKINESKGIIVKLKNNKFCYLLLNLTLDNFEKIYSFYLLPFNQEPIGNFAFNLSKNISYIFSFLLNITNLKDITNILNSFIFNIKEKLFSSKVEVLALIKEEHNILLSESTEKTLINMQNFYLNNRLFFKNNGFIEFSNLKIAYKELLNFYDINSIFYLKESFDTNKDFLLIVFFKNRLFFSELESIIAVLKFLVYFILRNLKSNLSDYFTLNKHLNYINYIYKITKETSNSITLDTYFYKINKLLKSILNIKAFQVLDYDINLSIFKSIYKYRVNIGNLKIVNNNKYEIIKNLKDISIIEKNKIVNCKYLQTLLYLNNSELVIILPLKIATYFIGFAFIFFDKIIEISHEDEIFFSVLSDQLALVLRNYKLMIEEKEKSNQLEQMTKETIFALARAIEFRDPYTRGHSDRVSQIAVLLAENVGGIDLKMLTYAGMLHDIGKMGIPDGILLKQGRLSYAEWEVMKSHPVKGAEIVSQIKAFKSISAWIKYHHERWNGTGYPEGLKGEEIPLEARIIAVADAYEAMTSNRVYRKAMSNDKALSILKEGAGEYWDPDLINIALPLLSSREKIVQVYNLEDFREAI